MRGYRRAEKEFKEGEISMEQLRKSNPWFDKIKSILSQDPADEDSISAKGGSRVIIQCWKLGIFGHLTMESWSFMFESSLFQMFKGFLESPAWSGGQEIPGDCYTTTAIFGNDKRTQT